MTLEERMSAVERRLDRLEEMNHSLRDLKECVTALMRALDIIEVAKKRELRS